MEKLYSYPTKWFVGHHKSLYRDNPNIIGFRNPDEWHKLNKGDLVVYYQFGNRRLKGVYKVEDKGQNIDPNFGRTNFLKGELKYQCKIQNILRLETDFRKADPHRLSFYPSIKNKTRWDNRRVFQINNKDLDYLLSL